jgi:hypothetical protein
VAGGPDEAAGRESSPVLLAGTVNSRMPSRLLAEGFSCKNLARFDHKKKLAEARLSIVSTT